MPNLDARKARFAERVVEVATEADALYSRIKELMGDLFAEGFNDGGLDAMTDNDFISPTEYMTAAKLFSAMIVLQALEATFENGGNIAALRVVAFK